MVKKTTKQTKQVVNYQKQPDPGADILAYLLFMFVFLMLPWPRLKRRSRWGFLRKMLPLWRTYTDKGYVLTSTGQLEHRVIAESVLGRRLERWEDVHHMNGVRHDNRLENLCVMHYQDHKRYHEWYDWVKAQGTFPRKKTQLRKLREDFRGTILADVLNKKIG